MSRVYGDYVYGDGPRAECWWSETAEVPAGTTLDGDLHCDVAIVGGGVTGLNAALTLAEAGTNVALFEAKTLGWGASGRNGGFCCLGGARWDDTARMEARYGHTATGEWRSMEKSAVAYVDSVITQHGMQVDRHSEGETWLAHRARDMRSAAKMAHQIRMDYGIEATIIEKSDLRARGLNSDFHGAVEIPIGFALNPQKYVAGLVTAALSARAQLFERAAVETLERIGGGWGLKIGQQRVTAQNVLIATNGYSSEHLPPWLAGRYFPAQSSIVTTRPLTQPELDAQGWTSRQMCYDSRNLLHYFRLMPDNRMLFGLRGSLGGTPASDRRARRRAARDFGKMFPHWADVDLTHYWSGMVSLTRSGFPFVGAVPEAPGLFASLCYHGNGVAMGSYSGACIAHQILGNHTTCPSFLAEPPPHFPFGRFRRLAQPFAYAGLKIQDL